MATLCFGDINNLSCYALKCELCYHIMNRELISVGKLVFGAYTMNFSVSRQSCGAPAATHETRRRCSPSVSTYSATNVWRCVTTPDRGSAPSATVPLEPMTSTASTSPNSHRAVKKENSRRNQRRRRRRIKNRQRNWRFIQRATFRGYQMSLYPCCKFSLKRLVFLPHHCQLVINFVTKQIVTHLTNIVVLSLINTVHTVMFLHVELLCTVFLFLPFSPCQTSLLTNIYIFL